MSALSVSQLRALASERFEPCTPGQVVDAWELMELGYLQRVDFCVYHRTDAGRDALVVSKDGAK